MTMNIFEFAGIVLVFLVGIFALKRTGFSLALTYILFSAGLLTGTMNAFRVATWFVCIAAVIFSFIKDMNDAPWLKDLMHKFAHTVKESNKKETGLNGKAKKISPPAATEAKK